MYGLLTSATENSVLVMRRERSCVLVTVTSYRLGDAVQEWAGIFFVIFHIITQKNKLHSVKSVNHTPHPWFSAASFGLCRFEIRY